MNIYLYLNDQQTGPYTEEQLRTMLVSGTINTEQLSWHEGLAEWQPLKTILSIAPIPSPPQLIAPTTVTTQLTSKSIKACLALFALLFVICGAEAMVRLVALEEVNIFWLTGWGISGIAFVATKIVRWWRHG